MLLLHKLDSVQNEACRPGGKTFPEHRCAWVLTTYLNQKRSLSDQTASSTRMVGYKRSQLRWSAKHRHIKSVPFLFFQGAIRHLRNTLSRSSGWGGGHNLEDVLVLAWVAWRFAASSYALRFSHFAIILQFPSANFFTNGELLLRLWVHVACQ